MARFDGEIAGKRVGRMPHATAGGTPALLDYLAAAAELDDAAAVALVGASGGELLELVHGFALGGGFQAQLAAFFRLAVEGLGGCGRSADLTQPQHLDLKLTAGRGDAQHVAR